MRYVAKKGWSERLYPVAEALVLFGGIALILGILFFATWTGR